MIWDIDQSRWLTAQATSQWLSGFEGEVNLVIEVIDFVGFTETKDLSSLTNPKYFLISVQYSRLNQKYLNLTIIYSRENQRHREFQNSCLIRILNPTISTTKRSFDLFEY